MTAGVVFVLAVTLVAPGPKVSLTDAVAQTRPASAQRGASVGSAMVAGVVTTGPAKKPLARAIVSIAGTDILGIRQTVSDDGGRFVFEGLAPGRFTLTAEKPGYLKTYLGSSQPGRPPATPIAVINGQRLTDITIDVPRGGVIAGVVRDENGAPMASAQVSAQLMTYSMGVRKFLNATVSPGWVVTNDRGEYRLWGLPPGEYAVRAGPNGFGSSILTDAEFKAAETQVQTGRIPPPGSVPIRQLQRGGVFYPGVSDIVTAQTIALGLSEERSGVDIVSAPVPSFNIEYTGIGPGGRPIQRAVVGIASVSQQSLFTSLGGVLFDANGRGTIRGVPPGRYLLFGRGAESEEPNAPM
jgi:protocatechuate 3,4-dioxygenase beta subunit